MKVTKIERDYIVNFIDNFNMLKFTPELNNFLSISKNILYGPKLSKKIFKLDQNICKSDGFENINLGRYWADNLVYQINKLDKNTLVNHLKNKKMLELSDLFNIDGTQCDTIIATPNEYPYIIPNTSYKYFIIWDLNSSNLNIDSVITILKDIINNKDYVVWRNPPIYKSVKTIEHYHIITRPKTLQKSLKKLFVVSRHGPREPIHPIPKFIKTYWSSLKNNDNNNSVYTANLTNLGKLYCNFIGRLLSLNYSDNFDFSILNNTNTFIASTNFDRTIQSAILTLDGLNLTNTYSNIKIIDFIGSDTIFTSDEKKSYDHKMSNPQINWDVNLENINKEIEELTGFKIKTFRNYFDLACTMKCYDFQGYQMLSSDLDNKKLLELKPTIYNLATYYYNIVHNPKDEFYSESKILGTTVIKKVLELFKSSQYFFAYFSTHDNIIMPVVKNIIYMVLNDEIKFENLDYDRDFFTTIIRSKINYLDFPDFNSQIRFELWEDSIQNQTVRIYYNSLMLFEFT